MVSLDGDADGLLGYSGFHSSHVVSCDGGVARALDTSVAGGVLASTGLGGVGVGGFSHSTMGREVVEGSSLVTSVTAVAASVAVDELLLSERQELAGLDLVSGLHRADGRESPA